MFDEKTCSILAPRANLPPMPLSLQRIYEAESRIRDVALVNQHKAPELLACFNIAYLDLNDHIRQLELLLHDAKKVANRRRSVVILDEVPKVLSEKGLNTARSPGGSEDQRQAVLDMDDEYVAHTDRVAQVKCLIELLDGKRKAIEWAYTSVKKILGGETNWKDLNQNRRLSTGGELPDLDEGAVPDPNSPRARFGGAR